MLTCVIIGDIKFSHEVNAGLDFPTVMLFSLVIDQFIGGKYSKDYARILFPLRFSLTDFSIC